MPAKPVFSQQPFPEAGETPDTILGLGLQNNTSPSLAQGHAAVSKAPAPLGFVQDQTPAYQAPTEKFSPMQRAGFAGMYGLQAGAQAPATTNAGQAVAGALVSGASGAAMGTAIAPGIGTAIGGGIGLLVGGMNAFFGNQAARRERDRANAQMREARRLHAEQVARDEAWRQRYFLQSLEEARYQRRKYEAEKAWEMAQKTGQTMLANIQSNAAIKDKYKKMGWF